MADYDSDSSNGVEDIETKVLLGYASKAPTGDDFSQLGGHPIWLDGKTAPDARLGVCRVCNSYMSLLLQLNGDLPDKIPGHERRVYVWACRNKACRRKDGAIRAFRATRQTKVEEKAVKSQEIEQEAKKAEVPKPGLGESLFGVKSPSSSTPQANPFATSSSRTPTANPFAGTSSLAAKPPQIVEPKDSLPQTFAEKVRISSPSDQPSSQPQPKEPWPETSAFPTPYPAYYIDADKEYIDSSPEAPPPQNIRVEGDSSSSGGGGMDKELFESTMDTTFQKFADRLSQNPEQILRYEYEGTPLLYSKSDGVGRLFAPASAQTGNQKVKAASSSSGVSKIPRCTNCGAERLFELQLTPHAITELETDEMGVEGMDWGTILFAACKRDCQQPGIMEGEIGYMEEWVGVQWEELAKSRK